MKLQDVAVPDETIIPLFPHVWLKEGKGWKMRVLGQGPADGGGIAERWMPRGCHFVQSKQW